ncbi:unnamed protein product [Anisakis simplex]|uniref:HBS1-like protein (inferred by orthology to a human protein) n=1 Tax=Anisakis simplex TaxID=6269 RepID=A0A0M3JTC2_ANISI|nr:unnamed protein product [Anisakis simplex]
MSRHRNFRNMNYDDERDDEDDEEFHRYSISTDDDIPMSPGTAKFMYHRPRITSTNAQMDNSTKVSDFIIEEELSNDVICDDDDNTQFEVEVEKKQIGDSSDSMRSNRVHQAASQPPSQSSVTFSVTHLTDTINATPLASTNNHQITTTSRQSVNDAPLQKNSTTTTAVNTGDSNAISNVEDMPRLRIRDVENLRISEKGITSTSSSSSSPADALRTSATLTPNASYRRLTALAAAQAAPTTTPKKRQRTKDMKPLINLVIVGHVDAGKSTLMGHLLYLMGRVDDRTMHKYKKESARTGKASFAFAWVLDDTQEERERGVTMDIARTAFETGHRRIVLLDAPGHKDFIPNMITGASQADAGLLVVNATTGEFETGFDLGGQTREHAMLLRSLGITELSVAVNKMDTVEWSEARYGEVCAVLQSFLRKQAAFPSVRFVPVSGLNGINLTEPPPDDHPLKAWYNGPTLLQFIDEISIPKRAEECPLRAVINNVIKATSNSITVSVKLEAGYTEPGERLFIMPNADAAVVKAVSMEDTKSDESVCFAGDHALLTLQAVNTFEPDSISCGQILCRGGKECLVPAKRLLARIVVFNIVIPIMRGTKAELFAHALCEPCTVVRLRSALNKANGQVLKQKPRCLARNMSGLVEIQTDHAIGVECYAQCKALGRITLRSNGQTIAAGIVEQIIDE